MDQIFNLDFGLSDVVGGMIKVLMIMITLVALMVVRQTGLMNRVINVPVGRGFVVLSWGFFVVSLLMTAIVVIVG